MYVAHRSLPLVILSLNALLERTLRGCFQLLGKSRSLENVVFVKVRVSLEGIYTSRIEVMDWAQEGRADRNFTAHTQKLTAQGQSSKAAQYRTSIKTANHERPLVYQK